MRPSDAMTNEEIERIEALLAAIPKREAERDAYRESGKIGESASYDRWVTQAHLDLHRAVRPLLPSLLAELRRLRDERSDWQRLATDLADAVTRAADWSDGTRVGDALEAIERATIADAAARGGE